MSGSPASPLPFAGPPGWLVLTQNGHALAVIGPCGA